MRPPQILALLVKRLTIESSGVPQIYVAHQPLVAGAATPLQPYSKVADSQRDGPFDATVQGHLRPTEVRKPPTQRSLEHVHYCPHDLPVEHCAMIDARPIWVAVTHNSQLGNTLH